MVTLGNAINFIRQVAADESGEDGVVIIDGIIAIEPLGPNFEHGALSNVTDLPEDEVKRLVDKTAWGATIIADTANGIGVPFGIIR